MSAVNLAIYHNTGGRPRSALQALERLGSPDALTPFHRLAYHWAEAQAHTAMGDVERSRSALAVAREVADGGLDPIDGRADYPQYFDSRRREALFRYLEASNLRAEGRYDAALEALDEALAGPRDVSDRKLLDARFLRALVHREMGNTVRSISDLEDLAEQVPRKLFRREAVYYHLAFARIERKELAEARAALARAIEITRDDNRALRKKLARAVRAPATGGAGLPASVARVIRSAYTDEGWIFSPAFEALGDDAPRAALLPGVGSYGERPLALGRLARIEWEANDPRSGLTRFVDALAAAPDDRGNLGSLIELGSRADDPDVARRAYDLVLEYLPVRAAPFGVETLLGRDLERFLATEPQADGSEDLAHLRARIVLLLGDLEAAESAFAAARREDPRALWPATGLAWVDLSREVPDHAAAVRRLDTVLDAAPDDVPARQRRDAHFLRGELRLLTGDPHGALADFGTCVVLEPTWELAREGVRLAREKDAAVIPASPDDG